MTSVERAARHWFRMKRPMSMTLKEHLKNPAINTTTASEARLARAVAALYKPRFV